MKRCPQCGSIATDDKLAFCRIDGVRLVQDSYSFSNSETVVLPPDEANLGPATDESPSGPAASTSLIDPSKATEPTVGLEPGVFVESTSIIDEPPNVPPASPGLIDSPNATKVKLKLSATRRRQAGIAVTGAIIAVTLIGSLYYFLSYKGNAAIHSLAVLPFINVNGDQQFEYLSDGMTEMLISNLSHLPELSVKARSSVFRYKDKDVAPRAVGMELNVEAVLNGRILVRGDVLTLSLELADAGTENIIWSEQYTRKQTDLVSLQSEVARDVSNSLRLPTAEAQKLSKRYTTNAEAYQAYLKGRLYWNKRTLKDLEKAVDYFNQAIALDQSYALAYAGLADAYAVLPVYRNEPRRQAMPPARDAANKALSLDPGLAEAHATLGYVECQEYDFVGAEQEFKRAFELDQNDATAHQWYGALLSYLSRNDESLIEFRRALEIDPLSLIINLEYAESLFYGRHYDEAIAQLKKTLELDTEFPRAYRALTKYYIASGNYAEAAGSYARYRELIGDLEGAALVRESLAKRGWRGCLRAMTEKEQLAKLSGYEAVVFLAALGEKEKALEELRKSYELFGPLLRVDPLLDPLRDDPRFAEILRRAGLRQG